MHLAMGMWQRVATCIANFYPRVMLTRMLINANGRIQSIQLNESDIVYGPS